MREAHPVERQVGIDWYVSDADPVGGHLRDRPEDFRVRELEAFDAEPLETAPGDYPYLVLRATLRGWDTNDFARRLSDALGVSRERVDWAGTKDKDAVTTQLFTVRDVDPGDLPDVRDADVGVVGRAGRHIHHGDLAGNAFDIAVRDPERPELVGDVTADLRRFAGDDPADPESRVAVPNYFGHQRFGSVRPVTHEVGRHVVRGEWREAVLAYVGNPVEAEPASTREARALVDEEAASADPDWDAALEAMPRRLRYERSMLHRLVETDDGGDGGPDGDVGDDGSDAAPDGDVDADDSDEARWRHALEAVPSNLQRLFVHAAQSDAFNRILSARLERGLPFHEPVAGDVCCFADADAPAGLERPDPDRIQRATADRVDVLTRHCDRGRAFVTAPLVGTETGFGEGEPGQIERDVLEDLGLSPGDFDLPGEFGSTGTRRAIMVRTDLDVERDPLTLSFSLPSGSYATVLLREYLKVSPRDL